MTDWDYKKVEIQDLWKGAYFKISINAEDIYRKGDTVDGCITLELFEEGAWAAAVAQGYAKPASVVYAFFGTEVYIDNEF